MKRGVNLIYEGTELFNYFLIESSNKFIDLVTLEYFTEEACNKLQLVKLNQFDAKKKKWKSNPQSVPRKFQNFHKCMIVEDALIDEDGFFVASDGSLQGAHVELTKILKTQGNFMIKYNELKSVLNDKDKVGAVMRFNEQNYVNHNLILMNKMDYMTAFKMQQNSMFTNFHVTTTFKQEIMVLAITPAEKFSNLEKLLLPFDELTWELLIGTFCVAFLVISIVSLMSKIVRNLVFGVKVNSPALNVIGTFFGISQTKLPGRNFARFMLINFVLFCLVMRTAYQGVLFEMVATDMRKKLPKKFGDIFDKNYTINCYAQGDFEVCSLLYEIEEQRR
jgi:hypothetical protein